MKERPILFSGPMVRAILAGTKTQTRRVFKAKNGGVRPNHNDVPGMRQILRNCPYGQPGDRLWVREAWVPDPPCDGTWFYASWAGCREGQIAGVPERFRSPKHCVYAAEWSGTPLRWTPSIHMPRWASRITLEVTGVRVERLQDISEADALAEGVTTLNPGAYRLPGWCPAQAYRELWEQINGPGSWDANPWVWVVEFRRLQ